MSELNDLLPDSLRVKGAGEGKRAAPAAPGPMPTFDLPGQEDYDAVVSDQQPVDTGKAGNIIAEAKKWVGTPYVWGGSGPLGFDCSGFTQYVMKKFGVDLPRVSYQQANGGKRVGMNELQAGDLVAWDNSSRNNGADHIAIYIGDGMVIHAPKPGDSVKISKIWDAGSAWGVRYL